MKGVLTMPTIYPAELKRELAERYDVEGRKVRCYYCKYWGYNCGKAMNDIGESRCLVRKKDNKTASYQFCRKYAPTEI